MIDCNCHCHSDEDGRLAAQGIQCKCIKNCIHCHPENFGNKSDLVILNEGEKIKTIGYNIYIDKFDYARWKQAIEQGKLNGAEALLGLLLGRAEPVKVIVKND